MTAQAPERLILDGHPRSLFADPLYRLIKRCRLDLRNPGSYCTANYRGYVGTWEIRDQHLHLAHLCWDGVGPYGEVPMPGAFRQKVLWAAAAPAFPIQAHWFSGVLRLPIGRRLIYSHHGWSSWFERERLIHVVAGRIVRDREVDTRAILEWWLRRHPEAAETLQHPETTRLPALTWLDDTDEPDDDDWWPPDYPRND